MPVTTTAEKATQITADVLVIGLFAESPPAGPAAEFDRASGGLLTKLIESGEISGKKGEVITLLAPAGVKAAIVAITGLGLKDDLDRGVAFRAAGCRGQIARRQRAQAGRLLFPGRTCPPTSPKPPFAAAWSAAWGRTCTGPRRTASPSARWSGPASIRPPPGAAKSWAMRSISRAAWSTSPPAKCIPNRSPPRRSASPKTPALPSKSGTSARLEAERCGSLLAVARGSSREPRLVILRYNGGSGWNAATGPRRQRGDVRFRRPLDQADRRHEDDEVRHGRRRHRAGGDAGHRPPASCR